MWLEVGGWVGGNGCLQHQSGARLSFARERWRAREDAAGGGGKAGGSSLSY